MSQAIHGGGWREGGEFSPGRLREDETPGNELPGQHNTGTAKPLPPGDEERNHHPGGRLFAFGISSATGALSPPLTTLG